MAEVISAVEKFRLRRCIADTTPARLFPTLPITPAGAPTAALAGSGAGNVENGVHLYGVSFVTRAGETDIQYTTSLTVVDKTADGQASLTAIPLGPTGTLKRKVYRSAAGATVLKLLTTLADNTTATYTDNTADASLGEKAQAENTTGGPLSSGGRGMTSLIIYNPDGNGILYIGDRDDMTTANGFPIAAGQFQSFGLGGAALANIYFLGTNGSGEAFLVSEAV